MADDFDIIGTIQLKPDQFRADLAQMTGELKTAIAEANELAITITARIKDEMTTEVDRLISTLSSREVIIPVRFADPGGGFSANGSAHNTVEQAVASAQGGGNQLVNESGPYLTRSEAATGTYDMYQRAGGTMAAGGPHGYLADTEDDEGWQGEQGGSQEDESGSYATSSYRGGGGGRGRGLGKFTRIAGPLAMLRAGAGTMRDLGELPALQEKLKKQETTTSGDELLRGSSFSGDGNGVSDAVYTFTKNVPLIGEGVKGLADIFTSGPMSDARALAEKSKKMEVESGRIEKASEGIRSAEMGTISAEIGDPTTSSSQKHILERQKFDLEKAEAQRKLDKDIFAMTPTDAAGVGERLKAAFAGEWQAKDKAFGHQVESEDKDREERNSRESGKLNDAGIRSDIQFGVARANRAGTGGSDAEFEAKQKEASLALLTKREDDLAAQATRERKENGGTEDTEKRSQMALAQGKEQATLDEQQAGEREDRERKTQQRILAAATEGQSAILRASGNHYAASLMEFDRAAAEKLEAVRTASKKEQDAVKEDLSEQRQAMQQTEGTRVGEAVYQSEEGGYEARLRAEKNFYTASEAQFNSHWDTRIRELRRAGKEEEAVAAEHDKEGTKVERDARRKDDIRRLNDTADQAKLRNQGRGAEATLAGIEDQNRRDIEAVGTHDPEKLAAVKRVAAEKIKGFINSQEEHPHATKTSLSSIYDSAQEALFSETRMQHAERLSGPLAKRKAEHDLHAGELGGHNAGAAALNALSPAETAAHLKEAYDKLFGAGDKLGLAADRITNAPAVLIIGA